jgi:hypothetical protein
MEHRIIAAIITGIAVLAPASAVAATLFQTGFEPPTYTPGRIDGQDGWSVFRGVSQGAAIVSTTVPSTGIQSVRITGSDLEPWPFGYFGGPIHSLAYDPLGSGTPIVDLFGDLYMASVGSVSCGIAFSLNDDTVNSFGYVGVNTATGTTFINNQDNQTIYGRSTRSASG